MTSDAVLLLGLGLGVRHATDADHLLAVGSLVDGRRGTGEAVRVAALWGVGHSLSFLLTGLVVVLAGVRLPQSWESGAELLVAASLVVVGALRLQRGSDSAPSSAARPLAVGVAHGLAGTASLGLLCASQALSPVRAIAWLLLFALGTIAGMAALTWLFAAALQRSARVRESLGPGVQVASAAASVILGLILALHVLLSHTGQS